AGSRERDLLARWAVARCLAHVLPDEASRQDAARAAGGYLELGHAGPDVYERIEAYVSAVAGRKLVSITGKSIETMKCADLLGDAGLEKAIKRALAGGK
ncbi:MAG: hypothetical protein P4L98_16630, partial [Ancalomicrobiaceae bacterium]|nr:hypothetical protein [Ancalomicrobiaceae bacterium]